MYRGAFQPPLAMSNDDTNNIIITDPQKRNSSAMPPAPQKLSHTTCVVRGSLAVALRITRIAGFAPLRMTHECIGGHNALVVSYSSYVAVYSWIMILILGFILVAAVVTDMSLEPKQAIRTRTTTSRAGQPIQVIILLSLVNMGVYGGPARVKDMINWQNSIEKVRLKQANSPAQKRAEVKRGYFFVGFITALTTVCVADFSYFLMNTFADKERSLTVVCLYITVYVAFILMIVLELQFVFVALYLHVALQSTNDCLSDLVDIPDLEPYNAAKHPERSLSRIMKSYSTICDVIRRVNKSYERILVFFMISFIYHLIVSLYRFIDIMYRKTTPLELCIEVCYLSLHTSYLIIFVEPGHRTDCEYDRTAKLVSQLLRQSGPRGPLTQELNQFYKQLYLNRIQCSPLGFCTISRPLITSIFGGVTTYLIVILGFQNLSPDTW